MNALKGFATRLRGMIAVSSLSDTRLALTLATGLGSVFFPAPGFQTPFIAGLSFLLRLNFPIVYAVNWLNNPVTVLPIALAGLAVGRLFFPVDLPHEISLDVVKKTPELLLPFFVGSLLLMVAVSLLAYFPALFLIRRFRR